MNEVLLKQYQDKINKIKSTQTYQDKKGELYKIQLRNIKQLEENIKSMSKSNNIDDEERKKTTIAEIMNIMKQSLKTPKPKKMTKKQKEIIKQFHNINNMKVVELKQIAKDNNIKGYSTLRKQELIDSINTFMNYKAPPSYKGRDMTPHQQFIVDQFMNYKPNKQIEPDKPRDIIPLLTNITMELENIYKELNSLSKSEIVKENIQPSYTFYLDRNNDTEKYDIKFKSYGINTPIFIKYVYEPSLPLYKQAFKLIDDGMKLNQKLFTMKTFSKQLIEDINDDYKKLIDEYKERMWILDEYKIDYGYPAYLG